MSASRDIEVAIRITGDTGIPDAQVIAAIAKLLDMPRFRLEEFVRGWFSAKLDADEVAARIAELLPTPGRWKVVPR